LEDEPLVNSVKRLAEDEEDGQECPLTMFGERVHYYHDSVMAIRFQELDNEVYAYRMPSGVRRWQRFEITGQQASIGFCP
jgi:hypothetical protein